VCSTRPSVEQVRVVDGQHDRSHAGLGEQPVDGPAEHSGGGQGCGRLRRQHLGQAAERQSRAGHVGRRGKHQETLGGQRRDRLVQQAALADAGHAAEDQPTLGRLGRDGREPGEFVDSPDEIPVPHRDSI